MPLLNVPPEVDAMVAAGSYELHSTVDIILGNDEVLHLATDALSDVDTIDFGMVDYQPYLRQVGQMNESITLAANRVSFTAQNVDHELGSQVVQEPEALDGCHAIHSYVFINDDDEQFQVEILHGVIVGAVDQKPDMSFSLVSHISTDGALGGHRTLQRSCFNHPYKINPRCASQSPLEQGCTYLVDGTNGCSEHLSAAAIDTPEEEDNSSRYTGFLHQIGPLPGTPPAGPTGVFDGGDDFNSYWRKRQGVGSYTGRHVMPKYLP